MRFKVKPLAVLLLFVALNAGIAKQSIASVKTIRSLAPVESVWFKFEDQAGPQLVDSEGGATATVIGDPRFGVDGSYDSAIELRGQSRMTIGYQSGLNPTQAFSASFWFRPKSFCSFARLVDTSESTGAITQGYRICLGNGDNTNNVMFIVRGQQGAVGVVHPEELRAGFWYYCVANYQNNGQLRLTVIRQSRQLTGSTFHAATQSVNARGAVRYTQASPVRVGANANGGAAFDGSMDELQLDNAVLQTGRILDRYRAGSPTPRYP